VQGDITGDVSLADWGKAYLKAKHNKPGNVFCTPAHRIDRPVSGLVVMARTSKALTRMNALFANREVQKTYWALTKRQPKKTEDTLTGYIFKDRDTNTVMHSLHEKKEAKPVELSYFWKGESSGFHLLEVHPKTGRSHQIRVQLANIKCEILGDTKYGYKGAAYPGRIYLHSRSVSFIHPVRKEKITLTAKIPYDDVWKHFDQLR
jgi:23S rRNA pseudouridine1911/1915/1917 synthase